MFQECLEILLSNTPSQSRCKFPHSDLPQADGVIRCNRELEFELTHSHFCAVESAELRGQTGMTFFETLRAYSTSRVTHSDALDAAVMTTTKLSQFVIPSSIFGQNFSSGWMALTSLKTSSKPAALRRNDSISAT